MKTNEVLDFLLRERFIVIARGVPENQIADVAEAVWRGGVRFFELTYDQTRSDALELMNRNMAHVCDRLGDKMILGTGTTITVEQVAAAHQAGAQFIVAPNTDVKVVQETKRRGLISCPGALTPTEIANAYAFGGDLIKLFPAYPLGTAYIKAIRGPLSSVPLMATGGVNVDNIPALLASGVSVVGTAPTVISPADLVAENYEAITQKARQHVEAIQAYREMKKLKTT